MEHRSAIILKPGDVISLPGRGSKVARAVNQTDHEQYPEPRSDITLKPGDTFTIEGLGPKTIGAIHQIRRGRYQLRLDEKFVESVTVDVLVPDGENRTPEQDDGPWKPAGLGRSIAILQTADQLYAAMGTTEEELRADLEGKTFRFTPGKNTELPPDLSHL